MELDPVATMQTNKNSNKKRFSDEQVKTLESMFSTESRPGSRSRQQIADQLGLHPRQVSVWFQNRRARSKSKQTERDYSILKAHYDNLASKFESLRKENQSLITEVQQLRDLRERTKDSRSDSSNNEYICLSSLDKHIAQPDNIQDTISYRDISDGIKSYEQETESQDDVDMRESADGPLASYKNHSTPEPSYLMDHNCISEWWEFWT